ncbi:MAG: hypothetical protein ABR906_00610 [Terracidiphilus sp.]
MSFLLLLALSAVLPVMAQQGQYLAEDAPFTIKGMKSAGGLATYGPIKSVDSQRIQLRGDVDQVFTFKLDAETVFCQGEFKVSDWSFLLNVRKKTSVTVLTNDYADNKALVVWDRGPSISTDKGSFAFAFPPMCK